jgi:predicted TIM-barrel fold metal-dependent hydrolase
MSDHLVIDADGHVFEPDDLWVKNLPPHLREAGPIVCPDPEFTAFKGHDELPLREKYLDRKELNNTGIVLRGNRFTDAVANGFDAPSALRGMEQEGITHSVLFPTRGLFVMAVDERVSPEVTTACATVYNDFISDYCRYAPDKLFGMAMIDPRNVQGAITEARRAVEDLGLVGIYMRPNPVYGRNWFSSEYDPLWATIEELDVPVCFHDAGAVTLPQAATDRFEHHGYWHIATHPHEAQMAMVSVVMGGVCERFPKLRFGFMECGAGWLPYWMWRMDEHFENERQWIYKDLTMDPSDYVKRQCFVAIDSDEHTGLHTLDVLGDTHVAWGSDYPHADGKFPAAYKTLTALEGMTQERLEKVVGQNALELYGKRLAAGIES